MTAKSSFRQDGKDRRPASPVARPWLTLGLLFAMSWSVDAATCENSAPMIPCNECPDSPSYCPGTDPTPCTNSTPDGVPIIHLSTGEQTFRITDIPIALRASKGPSFALSTGYLQRESATPYRHGPMGLWSHNYEQSIWKSQDGRYHVGQGIDERLLSSGPKFNVSDFSEIPVIGFMGKYRLGWADAPDGNLLLQPNGGGSLRTAGGGGGGCGGGSGHGTACGSCGGHAHHDSRGGLPPVQPWHATEGYEFEPFGTNDQYRLIRIVAGDGQAMSLAYSPGNLLTGMVTAVGERIRFEYDEHDMLINVWESAGGRNAVFTYTNVVTSSGYTNRLLASCTDMIGQQFHYRYDDERTLGALLAPDDASGLVTTRLERVSTAWTNTTEVDDMWVVYKREGVQSLDPLGHTQRVTVVTREIRTQENWLITSETYKERVHGPQVSTHRSHATGGGVQSVAHGDSAPTRYYTVGAWYGANMSSVAAITEDKQALVVNADGTSREYFRDDRGRITATRWYHADDTNSLHRIHTQTYTYFEETGLASNIVQSVVNEWRDAEDSLLRKTAEYYARDTRGTGTAADDIYTLVSERQWKTADLWSETRYTYTNALLFEVHALVGPTTNDWSLTARYAYDASNRVVEVQDALGNRVHMAYDGVGRLASISNVLSRGTETTDDDGYAVTTYAYDALDRVTLKQFPDGLTEVWNYGACGCSASTVDRAGNSTTKWFNANKWVNRITTVTTNGTMVEDTSFTHDGAGKVIAETDALGNVSTREYDSAGRLIRTTDARGVETQRGSDPAGRLDHVEYANGLVVSNTYDHAGDLMTVTDLGAGGEFLSQDARVYDALGRVMLHTDAVGNVTSNAYDLQGQLIARWQADNTWEYFAHDLRGNVTQHVGAVAGDADAGELAAATTTHTYDALNRRVATMAPGEVFSAVEYDPDHPQQVRFVLNAASRTNAVSYYDDETGLLMSNTVHGVTTIYTRDALGRVLRTTYADGSFEERVYDGPRPLSARNRSGELTTFTHDALNRTELSYHAAALVGSNAYDAVGQVISRMDALGQTTHFEYDAMGRQILTVLPDWRTIEHAYDVKGNLLARTGAGGVPVSYTYDAAGRMTSLIDGESNVTGFAYDALGRLVRKTYADSSFYAYAYDAQGQLITRTDAAGIATGYDYDAAGRLLLVDYASDPDVVYQYDVLGRTTNRQDAAGNWTWTYQGDTSLMMSETGPLGVPVTYAYTNTFELARVAYGSATTAYAWAEGRVGAVAWQTPGHTGGATYGYDEDGRITSLACTGSAGLAVSRTYDAAGQLLYIGASNTLGVINAFAYDYDSTGRRVRREDADGTGIDYGYDGYDQLTNAVYAKPHDPDRAAALRFGYSYDEIGNRLREDRGQTVIEGTFNGLNQLRELKVSGSIDVYGETSANTARVAGVTATLYEGATVTNFWGGHPVRPGSNAVSVVAADDDGLRTEAVLGVHALPANPQPLTYDANGNLLSDGQRVYTWDEENRLVALETLGLSDQRRSEFVYDGQSRRHLRRDYTGWNGTSYDLTNTTRFVWDGWLLLAETDATGTLAAYHAHGPDLSGSLQGAGGIGGLLARFESTNAYLYTFDGNGNVTDLVETNGAVVARYEYDPFGRTVTQTGSFAAANPWRFSTKQFEDAWGLYYYGYRYCSSTLGRFVSKDPAGYLAQRNLYGFARNNAVNRITAIP